MNKIFNKIFKVFLCLIISFVFLYAQPKQELEKAEAVVPLLLGILGSVVLDIAVDAGFAFADKQMAKKKADTIAAKLWKKHSKTLKDFKPTKKNLGKWALKLPAFLIAEIVSMWGDEAENVKENDDDDDGVPPVIKDDDYKYEIERVNVETDPFYNTSGSVVMNRSKAGADALTFFAKYGGTVILEPQPFSNLTKINVCVGEVKAGNCSQIYAYGHFKMEFWPNNLHSDLASGVSFNYNLYSNGRWNNDLSAYWLGAEYMPSWRKFLENLAKGGKKIYQYEGMLIIKNQFESYVRFDSNILSSEHLQKIDWSKLNLPSGYDDREFEFDFDFSSHPEIENNNEFEWEIVENDVQTKIDNGTIYNDYDFNYQPTINNNYVLTQNQKDALDKQISIIINNDIDIGGGDGGQQCVKSGKIVPCKGNEVEEIDGSLLAYVRNAYEYATGIVDTAIEGLKSLASGATGLTALYKTFFGWLPKEMQVLMASGLGIMIGLRIFRK